MNSSSTQRKILVTSALPYANGPIHLGHVLEGIQTDIWVRFQKAIGNECYFFCADDTHGTPVMLAARKEKITPEQLIDRVGREHYKDLTSFGIDYDNYDSTHSKANQEISKDIYLKLKENGHISKRSIEQAYCEKDLMFLPDRFIKGTCPNCNSKDQYGDNCEVCGATYNPKDLIDSHCALCGTPPVVKNSDHIFFKLGNFHKKTGQPDAAFDLQSWVETSGAVSESEGVKKKLKNGSTRGCKTGISLGTDLISVLKFRTRKINIFTFGWTLRSVTWLLPKISSKGISRTNRVSSIPFGRIEIRKSSISSVRIYYTFILYFGPQCWKEAAIDRPLKFTSTVLSE